jgi:cytidylate kinase
MADNLIITIGREFGSGGLTIGKMLAERLGVKCYDKELITLAAKESGLCTEVFEHNDEKPTSSFFYSLVMDTHGIGQPMNNYVNVPLNQKVFLAQFETIQNLAARESCVIVGRCADYALSSRKNVYNVFVTARMEDKITRISEKMDLDLDPKKVEDLIVKTDKKRANYYNYYTNKRWGSASGYDLCINSSLVGTDGAVELILKFLELKN